METIIFPKTRFGIATLLSGQNLTTENHPSDIVVISCLPIFILWTWINLLPLVISNQQGTQSVLEDKVTKPWRPIAAGRLSIEKARLFRFGSYGIANIISSRVGCLSECLSLVMEGWIYNAMKGAN